MTVPVSLSDQLAENRSDIVTYLRLKKAHHAAAWNTNKEIVESSMEAFLNKNISSTDD